jgi:uncharacterized protein (TIGR02996 family)
VYRDADVSAIEAAWTASDAPKLVEIGTRLGIALDLRTLTRLHHLLPRTGTGVRRGDLIATFLNAATGDDGIALHTWRRWLCLAVRHEDRVIVGFARGTKVSKAWPELKPWSKDVPSNRKRLDLWAATHATDRVSFGLIAIARPQVNTPPNTDELIRQIVETPHDHEIRSVLADLLIEHDDVRGKLMHLQTEIDALPLYSDERNKREVVVGQLVKQYRRTLAGEIAEHANDLRFAAGFVDVVTMTAAAFRDHGARLFAQQPIRRLKLQPANSATVATLLKSPIDFLRELEIYLTASTRSISFAPLADARLARLEALELKGMGAIDDEDAFAALQAPNLKTLRFDADVVATTLRGLAKNRGVCDRLEELTIRTTWQRPTRLPNDAAIADEAFAMFELPRLRRLVLDRCWFATPPRIAKLRERAPLLTDVVIETLG